MQEKRENIDEDKIKGFLENTLKKLKTEADIDTLTKVKKIYKRTVPFWLRSYVASYLIDEVLGVTGGAIKGHPRRDGGGFPKERREERSARAAATNTNLTQKNTADNTNKGAGAKAIPNAKTIFISMGKNRRLFPRDIMGLLINVGGLEKSAIGNIKILSNCTFVELSESDAKSAIERLSGYEYKHTTLAVDWGHEGERVPESAIKQRAERARNIKPHTKEIVVKLGDKADSSPDGGATTNEGEGQEAGNNDGGVPFPNAQKE